MHPLRVGVIGLGEVAQVTHLPILESLADRFTISAICDISPTLLDAMGERFRVPPKARHADFRDLAARDDVDVVFVINSDEYHAECAIAAMEHGKHVLVEKPMCLTLADAEAMIAARDAAGVSLMVGYMRRFAPALTEAAARIPELSPLRYVRVRDIIGRNQLMIDQAHRVIRPTDFPAEAISDRRARAARMVNDAIGEASPILTRCYRLLGGLSSHDLSAMRDLIGLPQRVLFASQWLDGGYLHVVMEYDGFQAVLETGVDDQVRFDAHIEVYGATSSLRVQYDTPYIRHLPTTLTVESTRDDRYTVEHVRPTFTDPYSSELIALHDAITTGTRVKTTAEDFTHDLRLFGEIIEAIRRTGTT
jgi:predicted dehydrogenase